VPVAHRAGGAEEWGVRSLFRAEEQAGVDAACGGVGERVAGGVEAEQRVEALQGLVGVELGVFEGLPGPAPDVAGGLLRCALEGDSGSAPGASVRGGFWAKPVATMLCVQGPSRRGRIVRSTSR
jgi:hypothetical protein